MLWGARTIDSPRPYGPGSWAVPQGCMASPPNTQPSVSCTCPPRQNMHGVAQRGRAVCVIYRSP